jgi:hypothetical protein
MPLKEQCSTLVSWRSATELRPGSYVVYCCAYLAHSMILLVAACVFVHQTAQHLCCSAFPLAVAAALVLSAPAKVHSTGISVRTVLCRGASSSNSSTAVRVLWQALPLRLCHVSVSCSQCCGIAYVLQDMGLFAGGPCLISAHAV